MTSHTPERLVSMATLTLALALAAACGSSNPTSPGSTPAVKTTSTTDPGTSGPTSGSTGTLTLVLKDSPYGDASAVFVTFKQVGVMHMSGGDWTDLPLEGADPLKGGLTCDLKKLERAADVLSIAKLGQGHYTQIRLIVTQATIYLNGTPSSDPTACVAGMLPPAPPQGGQLLSPELTVPSGEIKLNREFDVGAGGATKITLDFDGDKSIIKTGNDKYMMKPVIAVVSVE